MSLGVAHTTERSVAVVLLLAAFVLLSGCSLLSEDATLAVTPAILDFGAHTTEMQLAVQVTGDTTDAMHWRIEGLPTWADASPAEGYASEVVTIRVVRSGCGSGDHDATFRIEGTGGAKTVHLHMFVGGG